MIRQLFLPLLPVLAVLAGNAQGAGPASVSIEATEGMQYDMVRFRVNPGSRVTITLTNASDMSHNLVITEPGARLEVVKAGLALAEKGPQMNYIPKTGAVLWSIPVVPPGQNKSLTFTAPEKPGVYPYVCTYPGHGIVMFGAMYVTQEKTLPDLKNDPNIPESRRKDGATEAREPGANSKGPGPHPYPLIPPYLYHVLIDGASPDAIAVHLPGNLSYCWDAGTCRLRFAWNGGFVDMTNLWKGHVDASAKILGDIFFRDNTEYPIRVGGSAAVPVLKYMGYRLVDRYPEFHYTLNGTDVYELIQAKEDGSGLIRIFRIPHARQEVWFLANHQDDAIQYETTAGRWENKKLRLSPADAKQFTITMTSFHLRYQKKKK